MSTSTTKKTSRTQAFTLIELLVVITIIAILAALAFPAIGGAMDSAKKTTAKNAAVQIANAVVAYETEYGRLPRTSWSTAPTGDFSNAITGDLVKTLSGGATNDNPRAIVFIETSAYKKSKGGTNSSGEYLDPWGGTYLIALDYNYDNTITAGTNSISLRKKVGVWNTNAIRKLTVNSWD